MSEEKPQECAEPGEPKAKSAPEKTSDYYRISEKLPIRFNNPGWFHGYRTNEAVSMYRTSNQTYGSRAPTVHEMPKWLFYVDQAGLSLTEICLGLKKVYYPSSNKFSRQHATFGMFRSHNINVTLDKSIVTGPDNHVTHYDRLNFHPSYNVNRPSFCD